MTNVVASKDLSIGSPMALVQYLEAQTRTTGSTPTEITRTNQQEIYARVVQEARVRKMIVVTNGNLY